MPTVWRRLEPRGDLLVSSEPAAQTDVEEMDREALEAELRDLRERVAALEDDMETVGSGTVERTVLNHLLERLIADLQVDDYTSDPMQHLATVDAFGAKLIETIDAVDEAPQNPSGDPMTENWQGVVEEARRKQDNPQHAGQDGWVYLYAQDVADATGSSKRWGRELIEELGEGHEGAKYRSAGPDRKKSLLVDLDVWGETA